MVLQCIFFCTDVNCILIVDGSKEFDLFKNFFFQHAAGDPVFRQAVFIVGKILGLNDFIHYTAFRDPKRKQIFFIYFWGGDESVFSDFIGMKGEIFTDGALIDSAIGKNKKILGYIAGSFK